MRTIISLFILILLAIFSLGFLSFNEKIGYKNINEKKSFDGIAVLTGGQGRIKLGLDLWKENPHVSLIISGVDKNFSKESILPEGYNSDNIYFDNISESTYQNAISINKWIKENSLKKIKVITSYYHMPRSMLLLKGFSPNTYFMAMPVKKNKIQEKSIEKNILSNLFLMEEYIKYLLSKIIVMIV